MPSQKSPAATKPRTATLGADLGRSHRGLMPHGAPTKPAPQPSRKRGDQESPAAAGAVHHASPTSTPVTTNLSPPAEQSPMSPAQHPYDRHHPVTAPFRAPSKLLPPSGELVYVRQQHSPDEVLAVPATCIAHMPRGVDASRLFLCQWSAGQGWQSCPHGSNCPFVHADLDKAVVCSTVHEINPSWRCLGDVHYERAEPGATLTVNLPNTRKNAPSQSIPRECFLATRCLAGNRRPVSHCAHFFTKGICHRGAQCCFAHVVFLPMEAPADDIVVAPAFYEDEPIPGLPADEPAVPAVRRNDPYRALSRSSTSAAAAPPRRARASLLCDGYHRRRFASIARDTGAVADFASQSEAPIVVPLRC